MGNYVSVHKAGRSLHGDADQSRFADEGGDISANPRTKATRADNERFGGLSSAMGGRRISTTFDRMAQGQGQQGVDTRTRAATRAAGASNDQSKAGEILHGTADEAHFRFPTLRFGELSSAMGGKKGASTTSTSASPEERTNL